MENNGFGPEACCPHTCRSKESCGAPTEGPAPSGGALAREVLALAEELAEIRWWPEAGWPQGMANWARMAVSDGRQEAGGLVLNLASLRFSGQVRSFQLFSKHRSSGTPAPATLGAPEGGMVGPRACYSLLLVG